MVYKMSRPNNFRNINFTAYGQIDEDSDTSDSNSDSDSYITIPEHNTSDVLTTYMSDDEFGGEFGEFDSEDGCVTKTGSIKTMNDLSNEDYVREAYEAIITGYNETVTNLGRIEKLKDLDLVNSSNMDCVIDAFHNIFQHVDEGNERHKMYIQNGMELIDKYYIDCCDALKNLVNEYDDFLTTLKITTVDNYLIEHFKILGIQREKLLNIVPLHDDESKNYCQKINNAHFIINNQINSQVKNIINTPNSHHQIGINIVDTQEKLCSMLRKAFDTYSTVSTLDNMNKFINLCIKYDNLKVSYDEIEELIVQFNEMISIDIINNFNSQSLIQIKDAFIMSNIKIYDPINSKFISMSNYNQKINHIIKSMYTNKIYYHMVHIHINTLPMNMVYTAYKEYWNYVRIGNPKLNINLEKGFSHYVQYMMDCINKEMSNQHNKGIKSLTLSPLLKEFYNIKKYDTNKMSVTEIKSLDHIRTYLKSIEEQLKSTGFLNQYSSLDNFVY